MKHNCHRCTPDHGSNVMGVLILVCLSGAITLTSLFVHAAIKELTTPAAVRAGLTTDH